MKCFFFLMHFLRIKKIGKFPMLKIQIYAVWLSRVLYFQKPSMFCVHVSYRCITVQSSLFKYITLFWLFKFNICFGIFCHSSFRTTLHIQQVIDTFRALCAILKRQTVMSQELLICENNIMHLSLFHIQDIKESISFF